MERESFEDEEIAAYINEHFIAIKVDREERPDVDDIYMKAVNILAGRGGWPMTVVMTPQREPFFGGTYFPARDGDRGSRKGFFTILKELSERYRTAPTEVVAEAQKVSQRIRADSEATVGKALCHFLQIRNPIVKAIDHDEIIAAAVHLGKRESRHYLKSIAE